MGVKMLGRPCGFTPPLTPPRQGEGESRRASLMLRAPLNPALVLAIVGGLHVLRVTACPNEDLQTWAQRRSRPCARTESYTMYPLNTEQVAK